MDGLKQRSKEDRPAEENYSKDMKKKTRTPNKGFKTLAVAVLIPLGLGVLDAVFFNPNSDYYKQLKKPSWNPPGWVFGLAWSVFYTLMGVASWLVWVEGGFQKQARPLAIYAVQLVVNLAWPAIFTGLRNRGLALADLCLLDVLVFVCIVSFKPVNHVAADLLKPYLVWVLFATALNYKIYTLNLNP